MLQETCTAQDIVELNRTKEYMFIAANIIDTLAKDRQLTANASKIWQFLYMKARFRKDLSIEISYSRLANEFSCSPRTVIRWMNSLKKNNYIVVKNNFKADRGGQIRNTFFLRLPQKKFEDIKFSKDRKKPKLEIVVRNEAVTITNKKDLIETKSVNPPHDNSVIQKDISFLNNNINNNTQEKKEAVVFFDSEKIDNEIKEIEKNEDFLKTKILKEEEKLNVIMQEIPKKTKTHDDYCEQRNLIGQLSANLILIRNEKQSAIIRKKKIEKTRPLTTEITFMAEKEGNRNLSEITYRNLVKNISILGYKGPDLIKLVNEITFESRFGSLIKNKQSEPLVIEKSINIALKLLREGRWTTPSKIQKFMEC